MAISVHATTDGVARVTLLPSNHQIVLCEYVRLESLGVIYQLEDLHIILQNVQIKAFVIEKPGNVSVFLIFWAKHAKGQGVQMDVLDMEFAKVCGA